MQNEPEIDNLTKSQTELNYFYLKKQFEMFNSKNNELTIHEVDESNEIENQQPPPPPLSSHSSNNQPQIYSITYNVFKNQANLIVNQCECQMNKEAVIKPTIVPLIHINTKTQSSSSNLSQRKDWQVAKIFILVKKIYFLCISFNLKKTNFFIIE